SPKPSAIRKELVESQHTETRKNVQCRLQAGQRRGKALFVPVVQLERELGEEAAPRPKSPGRDDAPIRGDRRQSRVIALDDSGACRRRREFLSRSPYGELSRPSAGERHPKRQPGPRCRRDTVVNGQHFVQRREYGGVLAGEQRGALTDTVRDSTCPLRLEQLSRQARWPEGGHPSQNFAAEI